MSSYSYQYRVVVRRRTFSHSVHRDDNCEETLGCTGWHRSRHRAVREGRELARRFGWVGDEAVQTSTDFENCGRCLISKRTRIYRTLESVSGDTFTDKPTDCELFRQCDKLIL